MGMVDILKTLFVELDMKLKAKVISRRGLNPARITWPGGGVVYWSRPTGPKATATINRGRKFGQGDLEKVTFLGKNTFLRH